MVKKCDINYIEFEFTAKPDQNKPKPKKASELAMDDSDYELSQHQLNDRELSEDNDLNQMEDVVDS